MEKHPLSVYGFIQTAACVGCDPDERLRDGSRILYPEPWGWSGWSLPDKL